MSLAGLATHAVEKHNPDPSDGLMAFMGQSRDLVGVMITLVIAGVVGFVGINVMSETHDQTALTENDTFYNASTELTGGIDSAFGLVGLVFTVLMLAVIVVYLVGLRGR